MSGTPKELLQRFFRLQESRVDMYRRFKSGFDDLMAAGDMIRYDALCREITAEMGACSLEAGCWQRKLSFFPLRRHNERNELGSICFSEKHTVVKKGL